MNPTRTDDVPAKSLEKAGYRLDFHDQSIDYFRPYQPLAGYP